MFESMHKKRGRKHSGNPFHPPSLERDISDTCSPPNPLKHQRVLLLAAMAGHVREQKHRQKEGTTRKERNTLQFCVASIFILIAGEQCCSTPPTAWACDLVAQSVPTHAIWLACFLLLFFNTTLQWAI